VAESPVARGRSLYVLIPIYISKCHLYNFYISFHILLISNSYILPLNCLIDPENDNNITLAQSESCAERASWSIPTEAY
jgi:hypothetical protein